jgi:hypothetical protein
MDQDKVRRPVRLADFIVIGTELVRNIAESFAVATDEIMQLAIYNANRETELNNVWEKFASDLETITEDSDGA